MKIKKCPNGHQYDYTVYHDKCPFCPTSTRVNSPIINDPFVSGKTQGINHDVSTEVIQTVHIGDINGGIGGRNPSISGGTIIRVPEGEQLGRRLVALLVSYSANPNGEFYGVYEGITKIGRDDGDITFPNDGYMSSNHLLIQYVDKQGIFKAQDTGSSNGSYVNGVVFTMGDTIELKPYDVIVLGNTKFLFIPIPKQFHSNEK